MKFWILFKLILKWCIFCQKMIKIVLFYALNLRSHTQKQKNITALTFSIINWIKLLPIA